MIQPHDLLSHAVALARGGGDEVDTRRAVSAAYYALFHALAISGASVFASAGPAIAAQVARSFEHTTMLQICKSYLTPGSRQALDSSLVQIAQVFVDLQGARHSADYDLAGSLTHLEAARLVASCVTALRLLPDVVASQEGQGFLARLLLGSRMTRRG